jgi:ribonuclease Z
LKKYFETQKGALNDFQNHLQSLGIDQFYPCPVIHCPQSYGICIRHHSGVKVSYSGDTRPCEEFAEAAVDSTILIHEATHGDDLALNAFTHFHSTVGQAIDM